MKYAWMVVGLALILSGADSAQGQKLPAEKSKLIALENAWNQAQLHRDGSALQGLVSDNYVYTDTDGTVSNKAKFIADIKDPAMQMTLLANEDMEVFVYPGVAIVTGEYHAKGKYQGKAFDHYGRFTDTWIRTRDEWQCVATHTNLIKK